jgi:hypothetical protein
MRALGLIVVLEVAILALVVVAVLHSDHRERFPAAIAASVAPGSRAPASVPVSILLRGRVGSTRTVSLARGGQAVAVPGSP